MSEYFDNTTRATGMAERPKTHAWIGKPIDKILNMYAIAVELAEKSDDVQRATMLRCLWLTVQRIFWKWRKQERKKKSRKIHTFPSVTSKTGSGALSSSRTSFRCHRRRRTMSNPFSLLWNRLVKIFAYSQPSFVFLVSSSGCKALNKITLSNQNANAAAMFDFCFTD